MQRWLGAADPGRVHTEGRMARAALEEAREQVAALLGARAREVVFTSGATARQHPVICAVDRGMVRGMLAGLYGDTIPQQSSSRALGDDACVTLV